MEADVQSDVHTNLGNGNQEIHQISESFQYCEISDCKVLSSSVKLVKLVTENVELSKDSDNDYPANKDAKDGDGDVLNDKSDLSSPHVVVKVPDRTDEMISDCYKETNEEDEIIEHEISGMDLNCDQTVVLKPNMKLREKYEGEDTEMNTVFKDGDGNKKNMKTDNFRNKLDFDDTEMYTFKDKEEEYNEETEKDMNKEEEDTNEEEEEKEDKEDDTNTDKDCRLERAPEKHVQIHENIEIHEASDTNSEGEKSADQPYKHRHIRKEGFSGRKEIVGILKPGPPPGKQLRSFPSLPDIFLQELGLTQNGGISMDQLSEQDIESKFCSLSLAFKTDRVTLADRLDLQLRQRDIAEKNVSDEMRQLKTTIKSLNRVCQDSDTRDILERVTKQISILQQSTGRVASSAEQYGAVQQEMRIATSVEIMLLHLENIKRSFEREHSELEETKRILVQHKLIESEGRKEIIPRNRSISVIQGSKYPDLPELRRASLSTGHSHSLHSNHNSNNSLTVDSSSSITRPKSPTLLQMVSVRSLATTVSDEFSRKLEKKTSIFRPIAEEGNKNDSNNNSSKENKNRGLLDRRRDSRRQSQFDVDTIIEEIDELAVKRDSSPTPPTVGSTTPLLSSPRPLVLPSSPAEILKRKKSLILHLQTWYSDLYWPYDEEETILGLRYFISGLLSVAAFAIVVATLIG